jgi:hypothetical protein
MRDVPVSAAIITGNTAIARCPDEQDAFTVTTLDETMHLVVHVDNNRTISVLRV